MNSAFTILLCTTGTSYAEGELHIPDIGDSAASLVTLQDEYQTGAAIVRNIRRAGKLLDDALLHDYINQVGYKLVSVSDNTSYKFNFFIVNDRAINAFALPGGFIGVNYGLILASRNESELASVLAHEIAHVTQRHYARAYDMQKKYSTPLLAALIAAIVLGATTKSADLATAGMASIAGAQATLAVNFTRENEKEADRIGIKMLAKAGFDPNGMADFFQLLYNESRLYGPQGPEFLRTHPLSQNRMAEARQRASKFPTKPLPTSDQYLMMKERIHVLTQENYKQLARIYKKQITNKEYINKDASYYGYILSLIKNKQTKVAYFYLKPLLKKYPNRIAYLIAEAQIASAAKQNKKATTIYKEALAIYPHNESIILYYTETLINQKRFRKAKQLLDKHLRKVPAIPVLYKYLSRVEAQLGNTSLSFEALSNYYYQLGQVRQALNYINQALKTPRLNFYTESRLSARKQELQQEITALSHKT